MKKILLFLLIFLSSCITVPDNYTPRINSNNIKKLDTKSNIKKDITFSISYYDLVGADSQKNQEKIKIKITNILRKKLIKTNLFNKVHYVTFDEKSNNHLHFEIKLSGTNKEDSIAIAMLSGYTLMTIPFWNRYNIDTTMFIYNNNKEIFSITAIESFRHIYWLPFIILSPILNYYTAINDIINRTIDFFIYNIIENKLI